MSIRIGDDVWVGYNATILKAVRTGDGAIIGASAMVTIDVATRTMCCGNPARVEKANINWE